MIRYLLLAHMDATNANQPAVCLAALVAVILALSLEGVPV